MRRVTFHDQPFVLVGDSLEDGGAIATEDDFTSGRASYAHLFPDGVIRRFREEIGTRADLVDVGPYERRQSLGELIEALHNLVSHDSWGWK